VLVIYVISSVSVLVLSCWPQNATRQDGVYAVFYLYLPILYPLGDADVFESYLMWWMRLFDTMPPG
jgi:hypothetical protein